MKLKVNNDLKSTIKICKFALKKLEIDIDEIDLREGIIYASTKSSLISWGENVKIELIKNSASSSFVQISSEAKAQLITWGKNDENIIKIGKTIKELSKSIK